jgi:hypothetical protein
MPQVLTGITAQLVLSLDPAADFNRAQLEYDAHLLEHVG